MGDGVNAPLRLQFNPKVRLEFHGSNNTALGRAADVSQGDLTTSTTSSIASG